jgi:RND family efflux transporter MFP subunit
MTSHTMTIDRRTAAAASLGLLLVGAAGTLAWLKAGSSQPPAAMALTDVNPPARILAPPSEPASISASDIAVTLSPEAVKRAGIVVSKIDAGSEASFLRVPGVVEANHYRQVAVTALAAGRVTKVQAELGQGVRRGQSLASIYSPELAEARARFGAARAELEAHDRELQRTQKLAAIGAASRQELDRIHAEHTAQLAMVESARARLELLGGRSAVDGTADAGPSTTVDVLAPLDGTVTERSANAGLNVEAGTPLFTVADLSTVWVVAELFEQDFARVRVGTPVTVSLPAYPDMRLQARVSYIDPQVSPATRTAKVRVELPNAGQQLRLGMYADVQLGVASAAIDATGVTIPRAAVQTVGDRSVVYVASASVPGQFVERAVRLGDAAGEQVRIVSGLTAGESVVVGGSFFIRAEAERLGLRPRSAGSPLQVSTSVGAAPSGQAKPPAEQGAQVKITEKGFEPTKVELRVGVPATLTFTRVTDATCAKEIVFPSLKLRKPLPLNQAVDVRFTPAAGETAFVCGMDMLKGTVVAR